MPTTQSGAGSSESDLPRPDDENLPAGHYRGRGGDQRGTGPSGPWLERGPARFERSPDAGDEDSPVIGTWPSEADYRPRPPRVTRSDEQVREDVCEALALHPDIDVSDVEVSVDGGVVTLSGTVRTRLARYFAEDLALSANGVADVVNGLRVRRPGFAGPMSGG